jgi:hypothetical protein
MSNAITVGDHEVKVDQSEYAAYDDDGNEIIRATGRSTWWCSCRARGAGPNAETTREILDHLGIDENGEVLDRGE